MLQGPDPESGIVRIESLPENPRKPVPVISGRVLACGQKQRVDPSLLFHGPLNFGQGQKQGPDRGASLQDGELSQVFRLQDAAAPDPQRGPRGVPPAMKRFGRSRSLLLQSHQQTVPFFPIQFPGQFGTEEGAAAVQGLGRPSVECPEPLVHSVDLDPGRQSLGAGVNHRALPHHEGADAAEIRSEAGMGLESPGQVLGEGHCRRDGGVGIAQALQHQRPEAGADRIAHQEGAGQRGHAHGHAPDDGQLGGPVVDEASYDDPAEPHRGWSRHSRSS